MKNTEGVFVGAKLVFFDIKKGIRNVEVEYLFLWGKKVV